MAARGATRTPNESAVAAASPDFNFKHAERNYEVIAEHNLARFFRNASINAASLRVMDHLPARLRRQISKAGLARLRLLGSCAGVARA
jgi:hypothetical protein